MANYVYILSQNGNGYDAADFNLDVYTPTGEPLFYQQGLVAAGLVVDLWRNVYTLNFQQISGPGGRPEPSISEYIPSTPKSSCDPRKETWRRTRQLVAQWQLWMDGVGDECYIVEGDYDFGYAGGIAIAGLSTSGSSWNIFDLGGGNIAVGIALQDANNQPIQFYWNSHNLTQGGPNNSGMALWDDTGNYYSTSIGAEQTFKLINMGAGRFALQITAGSDAGRYLAGQLGGDYPANWSGYFYTTGSFIAIPSNSPPWSLGLTAGSDQLPILKITNSGYFLNLKGKNL